MTRPRPSDRLAAWLRSFTIHGTWNHRNLLGAGLAYALLPILRRVHAGDPVSMREALERHLRTFNAHPYLASAAVGALARLESERADPDTLERFRTALGGPLGSLGDRVVWATWRPFCVLAAAVAYLAGASAVWCLAGFLVVYNAGHVALRAWGFLKGWSAGRGLGRVLRDAPLEAGVRILKPLNAVLVGAVTAAVALAAAPAVSVALPAAALLAAGIVAGYVWPTVARRLAPAVIMAAPLIGWLLG